MLHRIRSFFSKLHHNQDGKLSVEMILLIALIALPIILLLVLFRDKIITYFKGQSSQLQDPGPPNLP